MIIEIPDDAVNKMDVAKIALAHEAIKRSNYHIETASSFLGISVRALRQWFQKYPELAKYRCPNRDERVNLTSLKVRL